MTAGGAVRIVLRTGFDGSGIQASDLATLFPDSTRSVLEWGSSFLDWPGYLRDWPEPWLLFIDGVFPSLSPMLVRKLTQQMAIGTAEVLCLDTPLRRALDSSTKGPQLYSGFTAIRRNFFLEALPEQGCASLVFALSFVAQQLEVSRKKPLLLRADDTAPATDLHLSQLLRAEREHLARDFETHGATLGASLSPQFAVRAYGMPCQPKGGYDDWQHAPVRFSILCPAYKSRFIDDLLDSVEAQTYPHWELLLRVDGPPEPDRSILCERLQNRMHQRRIRWTEQDNVGTAATRARLAGEATGDFILFVDDDDKLAPETLAYFAEALDQHPEADAVRGGAQLFGLIERYLPPRVRYTYNHLSADLFEVNQPFAVRRTTLEALGGFEGDGAFGGVGEDTDLLLRIEQAGLQTLLIDAPLYFRRISPLNQTLLFQGQQFAGHVRTLAGRRLPPGWSVGACRFREHGTWVHQDLCYVHAGDDTTVHAPTEFFNFHTLGSDMPKAVVLLWEHEGAELSLEMAQDILAHYDTSITILMALHHNVAREEKLRQTVNGLRAAGWAVRYLKPGDATVKESLSCSAEGMALPWRPTPEGWEVVAAAREALEASVPDWREAGVCGVAAAWDVYAPALGMVVCPARGAAGYWHAPVDAARPREGRLLKLGQYRRGYFREFCNGCPYCPEVGIR